MSYQLKWWDSKREREKINRPNTLPAVHRTKGWSKPRGASQLWTGPAPPEAGGRGEGKGAGSAPRTASPTTLQTGLQFLTKDFLRFWMVDIAGRVTARHKAQAPDRRRRELGLGTRRGEGALHPGRVRLQAPGCLSLSGGEGAKRRCSRVRTGEPEGWNRLQRGAGSM